MIYGIEQIVSIVVFITHFMIFGYVKNPHKNEKILIIVLSFQFHGC